MFLSNEPTYAEVAFYSSEMIWTKNTPLSTRVLEENSMICDLGWHWQSQCCNYNNAQLTHRGQT